MQMSAPGAGALHQVPKHSGLAPEQRAGGSSLLSPLPPQPSLWGNELPYCEELYAEAPGGEEVMSLTYRQMSRAEPSLAAERVPSTTLDDSVSRGHGDGSLVRKPEPKAPN